MRLDVLPLSLVNPDELTPVQKVYRRKEWGRMEDWRQLEAGEITAVELNDRNSLVLLRGLAENPEWKRTALEPVINHMAKDHPQPASNAIAGTTRPAFEKSRLRETQIITGDHGSDLPEDARVD